MDRRVILSKYVVIDVVFSNFDVFVHNNPEA